MTGHVSWVENSSPWQINEIETIHPSKSFGIRREFVIFKHLHIIFYVAITIAGFPGKTKEVNIHERRRK